MVKQKHIIIRAWKPRVKDISQEKIIDRNIDVNSKEFIDLIADITDQYEEFNLKENKIKNKGE